MTSVKMTELFSVTLTVLSIVGTDKESGTSQMEQLLVTAVMEVTCTETEDQVLYV